MQMQRTFFLSEQQELQGGSGILIWVVFLEKLRKRRNIEHSSCSLPNWNLHIDWTKSVPLKLIRVNKFQYSEYRQKLKALSTQRHAILNLLWTGTEIWVWSGYSANKYRFQTVILADHWEGCSMMTEENNLGPERSRQPSIRRFQIKWEQNLV